MPDAEHGGTGGYGGDEGNLGDAQEGQVAGPTGSPSGGHPDSTGLNYGGNQTAADLGQDAVRGYEGSTPDLSFDFGQATNVSPGAHPDQQSIQAAIDQENAVTGLYGAYDNSGYQAMKEAMHKAQNHTKNMAITGIDVETFDAMQATVGPAISTTQGFIGSPAFGKQINRAKAYEAVVEGMPIYGTGGGFGAKSATGGKTNPHAPAFSAKFGPPVGNVFEGQTQDSLSQAPPPQDDPNTAIFGSANAATHDHQDQSNLDDSAPSHSSVLGGPATPAQTSPQDVDIEAMHQAMIDDDNATVKNAPTAAQIEEARQAHRAIEARQWGKTALDAKTAWGVLDAQLKETETKTYFGLNFEVPKMSKFAKEKALIAFRDKYGKQIEAYNKHYNYQAKQSQQEPGLINPVAMLAGLINPILGYAVRVGQKYGYNESPMETAIREAEIDAGIREADHGDGDYIKKKKKVPTSGSDYVMDVVNPTNPGVMDVVNPTLYNPEPQD